MAFVARLPKSELRLQEGHYGSRLQLRVNPETQCCDGTYSPVQQNNPDSDQPDLPSLMLPPALDSPAVRGHAVLFGQITKSDPGSKEFVLKGEWRHVQGPLHGGPFEMKVDSEGGASGWWAKEGDEPCPWQWAPSGQDDVLEPLTACVDDEQSAQHRLRSSMSKRIDRSKTFYDEMLDSEGASSVMIARWGVLCGWIFFHQTLASCLMSLLQVSSTASSLVQCAFQGIYTATYISFLVIYGRMRVIPPLDYVIGVVLYTVGYACFLTVYALILVAEDDDVASVASQVLYLLGSLLFLVGSIVLVCATTPAPIPMLFRQPTWMEKFRGQFSMIDQQSSLFWGSVTFLLGSILFALDASWDLLHAESKPELLSVFVSIVGYSFFTVGRVYFLWGSTTTECNAFFCSGAWGFNWRDALLQLQRVNVADERIGKVSPDFSEMFGPASANSDASSSDIQAEPYLLA